MLYPLSYEGGDSRSFYKERSAERKRGRHRSSRIRTSYSRKIPCYKRLPRLHLGDTPSRRFLMSPFTRYSLTILILLYSIYQITNDHPIAGLIGVALGAALLWFGRKW